jgi:hypothetical protein
MLFFSFSFVKLPLLCLLPPPNTELKKPRVASKIPPDASYFFSLPSFWVSRMEPASKDSSSFDFYFALFAARPWLLLLCLLSFDAFNGMSSPSECSDSSSKPKLSCLYLLFWLVSFLILSLCSLMFCSLISSRFSELIG